MWIFNLPTPTPRASTSSPRYHSTVDEQWGNRGHHTVLLLTSKVTNGQRKQILTGLADPEPTDSWPERPKDVYARPLKAAKWIRNWIPGSKNAPSVELCIAQMVRAGHSVSSIADSANRVPFVEGGEIFGKRVGCGMILIDDETIKGLKRKKGADVIVVTSLYKPELDKEGNPKRGSIHPDHYEIKVWAARVPLRRANLLLSAAYDSTDVRNFDKIVPDVTKLEICEPANDLNKPLEEVSDYALPSHLPAGLKLSKNRIEIVSLVHLMDEELKAMENRAQKLPHELSTDGDTGDSKEQDDSEDQSENEESQAAKTTSSDVKEQAGATPKETEFSTVGPVTIYNWPSGTEPCTRDELYKIFQKIRPAPQDQSNTTQHGPSGTHAIFIDIPDPTAQTREPELLLVKQTQVARAADSSAKYEEDHYIEIHAWPENESIVELWKCLCDYSLIDEYKKDTDKKVWFSEFLIDAIEAVSEPGIYIDAARAYHCYILVELSETELRQVKAKLRTEHGTEYGAFEFNQVGKYLKSAEMKGLLDWFEDRFSEGQQPPHYFTALDQQSIDWYTKGEGDKDDAVIVASSESLSNTHYDAGVHDYIGMAYGRLNTEDAICACCQLSVANASFYEELVPKEKIVYAYWSDILESERREPSKGDYMSTDDDYTAADLDFAAVPQGPRAPEDEIK